MPIDELFGSTINLVGKSIDLRSKNHTYLTANIANVETPGFTPSTLSFQDELKQALAREQRPNAGTPALTNPRHLPLKGAASSVQQVQGHVLETPSPSAGTDGNGVELETEMGKMVENQIMYNASVQILSQKFNDMKMVIRGN